MATYNDFIKQNIAPKQARYIGVYDSTTNTKVGTLSLKTMLSSDLGQRLYSFGILSDVHNQSNQTAESTEDLQRALTYFNNNDHVSFTCICGDISENGTASEFQIYKTNVDTCSPNTPVYTTTGNHDCQSGLNTTNWQTYTGHERCFEITHQDDIFLFFGMNAWSLGSSGTPYLTTDIDWLENKLESYKNRRCFIFTHLFIPEYAGNFKNIYPTGNWLGGSQLTRIKGLVDRYKNTVWFSGHSHWKWYLQKYQDNANIYRDGGGWCVHIPSCASPIDSDGVSTRVSKPLESEGAIIDVYTNCIIIRGMDLKNEKFLPIATYKLDTTIQTITEAPITMSLTWESGKINSSTGEITRPDTIYAISQNITVDHTSTYTINSTANFTDLVMRVGYYQEDGTFISVTEQLTGETVLAPPSNASYMILRCVATNSNTVSLTQQGGTGQYYSITKNLNSVSLSNTNNRVQADTSYNTSILTYQDYSIDNIAITMGGVDITNTAYNDADFTIMINNVTGDLSITISASYTGTGVPTIFKTVTVNDFSTRSGSPTITTEGDYISATFTDKGQKFWVNNLSDVTGELYVEDVIYSDTSITEENKAAVGFYKSDGSYTISTGETIDLTGTQAQFNMSSSKYTGVIPLTIKMKNLGVRNTNVELVAPTQSNQGGDNMNNNPNGTSGTGSTNDIIIDTVYNTTNYNSITDPIFKTSSSSTDADYEYLYEDKPYDSTHVRRTYYRKNSSTDFPAIISFENNDLITKVYDINSTSMFHNYAFKNSSIEDLDLNTYFFDLGRGFEQIFNGTNLKTININEYTMSEDMSIEALVMVLPTGNNSILYISTEVESLFTSSTIQLPQGWTYSTETI